MNRKRTLGALTALVSGAALWACASITNDVCDYPGACSADGGSSSGDAIADTGPAPDSGPCTATGRPYEDGCFGIDGTGVFVNAKAAAGGDGTKGKPFNKLQDALNKGGRIYVCVSEVAETVTLSGTTPPATVFGGLDCTGWAATSTKTTVTGPQGAAALLATSANKLTFSDFKFVSLSAQGREADGHGKSSVAAIVSSSKDLVFTRVEFQAGDATEGAPGTTESHYTGAKAGAGGIASGSTPGANSDCLAQCSDGSAGGAAAGGGGAGSTGGNGQPLGREYPTGQVPKKDGTGGMGAVNGCFDGNPGADGQAKPGGGGGQPVGALNGAAWTVSGDGTAGTVGEVGQGGGGGGGKGTGSLAGGGGSCGGCGGGRGLGGKAGGASIALVAIESTIKLQACALRAGKGGIGGAGGDGQTGQPAGDIGTGACNGGAGGVGGQGGGGGGGAGGDSLPLVFKGDAPVDEGSTLTPGVAGSGGKGGSSSAPDPAKGGAGKAGRTDAKLAL